MKFEYISDDYDSYLESLKKEKLDKKEAQKKVHGDKKFLPPSVKTKGNKFALNLSLWDTNGFDKYFTELVNLFYKNLFFC